MAEFRKFFERNLCIVIRQSANGECHENFVHVEARVVVAELLGLEVLNRFNHHRRKQSDFVRDASQVLERIKQHSRRCTEERRSLARDDRAIVQFNSNSRTVRFFSLGNSSDSNLAVLSADVSLFHHKFKLVDLILIGITLADLAQSIVVTADDFGIGGFANSSIINDAVASHIHPHIRRALVRRFTEDARKESVQNREDFDVTVVVNRRLAVSFQVERVNHVHVVQVSRCSFVSEVDRVLERDVPNRERFKLGIASLDTALVFMINLREADSHLSTTRTRSGHHHEFARSFNKFILAITVIAHHERDVARITGNRIMAIDLESKAFELFLVSNCARLFLPASQHHTAHVKAITTESVNQAKDVLIVGNAEVATNLVLFDVASIDGDDDFGLILELFEHADFGVRSKARQNAACMMVIKKFSTKFKIKFTTKFRDTFLNFFRLSF